MTLRGLPEGPTAEAALTALGFELPRLPTTAPRTRMLGLGPEAGRAEVYLRAEAPAWCLPRLFEPAGMAEAAPRLIALIEEAWGHRIRDRLPGGSVGVSYARSAGEPVPVVTLFLFARALWGGDGRIRLRMLARLKAAGVPAEPYAAATRPLAAARSALTRHGMVGIALVGEAVHWSVGLRPVAGPC